jgi:digeranylgeranylglycerophospholipid reductase
MISCDVLVVGGGPAGLFAALAAARDGVNVVVAEQKRTIGQPVQCAEAVDTHAFRESNVDDGVVVQRISKIKTHWPDETVEKDVGFYMVNRSIFEKRIAVQAIKAGAKLLIATRAVGKEGDSVVLQKGSERIEVRPKVIIGADGPASVVARWMKSQNSEYCLGLQYEVPLAGPMDFAEFFLQPEYFGGYAWIFPKGETANAGLMIKVDHSVGAHRQIDDLLKGFLDRLEVENKVINTPVGLTSGMIPAGKPVSSVKDNILLVGDAASQTHSILGEGIFQAVKFGKIAGSVAAGAVKRNDIHHLAAYQEAWSAIMGKMLDQAYRARIDMETKWFDDFLSITKRYWTFA